MGNEGFIFWFWESPTTGWHAYKVKKHFHCLIICIYFLPYLLNDSQTIRSMINFSKLLLCMMLIWSHFHFIMPVMPDKAVFVSAVLLCVQRYLRNSCFTALPSGKEWICIFIQTNAKRPLMFHVDVNMKRLGIRFKNDSFQWFRVDSFFERQ